MYQETDCESFISVAQLDQKLVFLNLFQHFNVLLVVNEHKIEENMLKILCSSGDHVKLSTEIISIRHCRLSTAYSLVFLRLKYGFLVTRCLLFLSLLQNQLGISILFISNISILQNLRSCTTLVSEKSQIPVKSEPFYHTNLLHNYVQAKTT